MCLDQSVVLTVGCLSPRREDTPCLITPCLSFPPGVVSHRSSLAPQGHYIRAVLMQHMINKAYTRWVAANLISGHLVNAGNHRHGSAGHRQGRCSAHCNCEVRTQSVD